MGRPGPGQRARPTREDEESRMKARALAGPAISIFLSSLLVSAFATAGSPVAAQSPPPISGLAFLPGDAAVGMAPEQQNRPAIAAGGPGYLVVWQEMRTVLSGTTNTPYNPLGGNGWDIYGARLDADGNLLDSSPILITQEGRNQEDPKVAWNGENWLVVW